MKRIVFLLMFTLPLFAAIQYSGGTVVNTTFSNSSSPTRLEIVTGLVTALNTAGWTTISGTTDVILASATTPTATNQIRVEVLDPGSGNCAQVKIQNTTGVLISQGFYLLPGALKTWVVIANQYNFAIFTLGNSAPREFVMAGTLYIPTFLNGVIVGDLGWIQGNALDDGDTNTKGSFKNALGVPCNDNFRGVWSAILNNSLLNFSGSTENSEMLLVPTLGARLNNNLYPQQWHDGTYLVSDPLLAFGIVSTSDVALIRGQIHNAIVVSGGGLAQDSTVTIDTHTWYVLTVTNTIISGNCSAGQVLLATD
jgi:hypothetical protein